VNWSGAPEIWVRTGLLGPLLVPPGPLVNWRVAGEIWVSTVASRLSTHPFKYASW
jgi:hypothetical protein